MTRAALAALAALIIATTAVAAGGGDGHSDQRREPPLLLVRMSGLPFRGAGPLSTSDSVEGRVQAQTRVLRIPFLTRDGVAEPVAVAQPTAVITQVAEPLTIEDTICSVSWPCQEALAVAWCESRYDPNAVNPSSGAEGLFQLLPKYHAWRYAGRSPFDPQANVEAAYSLWEEQGWNPWTCKP